MLTQCTREPLLPRLGEVYFLVLCLAALDLLFKKNVESRIAALHAQEVSAREGLLGDWCGLWSEAAWV